MNETINKNYMTRNYQNYINMMSRKQSRKVAAGTEPASRQVSRFETTEGDSFRDVVNKYAAASDVPEAVQPTARSAQDMSMEEYKAYIADRISRLPMHPSHMQDSVSIHISEAGFRAMKEDPEYEEWVIGWLGQDFACNNPWAGICGASYVVHYIGATKEEYRGEGWAKGYQNGKGEDLFNQKARDSFWERRAKRHQEYQKLQEKTEQARAVQRQLQARQFTTLDAQGMAGQPPLLLSQLLFGGLSGGDVNV